MSEIYERNVHSQYHLAQLFLDTLAFIYGKKRNRWRSFFSSSGNAICLILLKYQKIYVQIQTFSNKD